jgi:hypothetical protein
VAYYFGDGNWLPIVELRGIAELVTREVVSVEDPFESTPPSGRVVPFVGPRAGLECRVLPSLAIRGAGGLDVPLAGFSFASQQDGAVRTLLTARGLRPALEVGMAFQL